MYSRCHSIIQTVQLRHLERWKRNSKGLPIIAVRALPCLGGCNSLNLFSMLDTRSAAAPEELDCLGMSACWVRPVAMSYTMGTMMLTGSWGTGMRWVSCSCESGRVGDTERGRRSEEESTCASKQTTLKRMHQSYKEEHFGLEHHSDGSRRGDGGSAWRDGETELDIPFQLSSLIRELWVRGYILKNEVGKKACLSELWNKQSQQL